MGYSPDSSMHMTGSALALKSSRQCITPLFHTHRSTHRSVVNGTELEDSLESSMSSLGVASVKPHGRNLVIGNFSEAVREDQLLSTGNTRLHSWGGEESSRGITGRMSGRSAVHRPAGPPPDALVQSSREVSRKTKRSRGGTAGTDSEEATPVTSLDTLFLFHDQVYPYLMQTYALVAVMIMRRCFVESDLLDYACCISHDPAVRKADPAAASLESSFASMQITMLSSADQTINPLFHIREYLDLCNSQEMRYCFSMIASTSANADGMLRLCKLLHPAFFENCLKDHMNTHAEKVGEGGFGTVYKVLCPEECGKYKSFSHCYGCYKRSKGRSSSPHHKLSRGATAASMAIFSDRGSFSQPTHSDHFAGMRSFAVKCIPRERSLYDPSVVFALFQEITALEKLQHLIGVCGIEDYGVVGGEYWLVMEHGWSNLIDWRASVTTFKSFNPSPKMDRNRSAPDFEMTSPAEPHTALPRKDVALFLLLYLDMLFILRDVHKADVAHFDLKASNFILREEPYHSRQHIWRCHQQKKASGVIFIADFGEAIPRISLTSNDSLRKRSRGTMSVQSPEMLCISEDLNPSEGTPASSESAMRRRSIARRSFKIGQKLSGQSADSSPMPRQATAAAAFPLPNCSSDIWSLGCLLVELFTGTLLFQDRSWPELFTKLCLSKSSSSWAMDLECLTPALASLLPVERDGIRDIVLAAMQKDVNQRASVDQLIVMTKKLIETSFLEDMGYEDMATLTYSHSGDSGDERRHSREILLSSLDREALADQAAHIAALQGSHQLDQVEEEVRTGAVSIEVFSVFQFHPFVWLGCESAIQSMVSPLLRKYAEQAGGDVVPEQSARLTCQTLLAQNAPTINAQAFNSCLLVDDFICSGCGVHAVTTDFLSDMLWLAFHEAGRTARPRPAIIWIQVTTKDAVKRKKAVKTINCLEIISMSVPVDDSAALKDEVKALYDQVICQWLSDSNPPIVLISVEDRPYDDDMSRVRNFDRQAFSSAMAIAGMISATPIDSEARNTTVESCLSWSPDAHNKYQDMEVLRLIGKLQRTMPWMDSLLDLYLLQDLLL